MATPSANSIREIQKAYVAFYGRPADQAGLMYWASELDKNGGNLSEVIQAFGTSVESGQLYGSGTNAERIEKIYQQLFNRSADEGGKAWYATEIDAGRMSLQSAALNILNGAAGADLTLINRKVDAAAQFTEQLSALNMAHAYGENDIGPARAYLTSVSASMSDAALSAHLSTSLDGIMNASWAEMNVSSSSTGLNYLAHTDGMVLDGSTLVFADTGRVGNVSKYDVVVATIDIDTLRPGAAASIGHTGFNEELEGLAATRDGYVAWGELDTTYNSNASDLSFVWKLDADFKPQQAIHIGTTGAGDDPEINGVLQLSNGKYLVYGAQTTYSDADDAFALVLNSDFSVYAQKRYDISSNQSYESIEHALELADGSLLVSGSHGELLKLDQNLNIIGQVWLSNGFYSDGDIYALEGGLSMVVDGSRYYIVDSNLNVKSYIYQTSFDSLSQTKPGHFVAYDGNGEFFNLHVNVNDPSNPVLEATDFLQIISRSGYGESMSAFFAQGDNVVSLNQNDLFSFNMLQDPSPNLAADYRLVDASESLNFAYDVYAYEPNDPSTWVAGDLQIVMTGTLPEFTAQTGLISLGTLTGI